MWSLSRRDFIQTGGAVSLAGLAGCASVVPWSSADESHLGEVTIENRDTKPHEVTFRVEWAGKVVHNRSYTLAANDPTDEIVPAVSPEATWPMKPGAFRVMARLGEQAWQTATPSDRDYPDCYSIIVYIDETGNMAILTTTNVHTCPQISND